MRPTVFLFSEPDAFSLYILENLLSNLCRVVVFSNSVKFWEKFTSHIAKTSYLVFDLQKNYNKYPKPNYFLLADPSETDGRETIKRIMFLSNTLNAKGFAIASEKNFQGTGFELPEAVGLITLDNLFGPRMELDERSRISQVVGSAVKKEKIMMITQLTMNKWQTPKFNIKP